MITLPEVVVDGNTFKTRTGAETNISLSTLGSMPTISRNLQDFVRMVPQAKVTGEGSISLAGQNNRFNAIFIDGANNTDIQGLSLSGTNGGQTGAPPISIEAIEEINVQLAPYDVQFGNFTGGSINIITRSGSNDNKTSAWYYYRNEHLAGRSPHPLDKPGSPGETYRPRLSEFSNQTLGAWNSGAIVKNKFFYFALLERQYELRPQPFNISEYRGNSNRQQVSDLSDLLRNNYSYDPGSFLETKDQLIASRINLKFDWNASLKNKFMLSYRFNNAERTFPPRVSGATSIFFENTGVTIPARTHSTAFEWKHFYKHNKNNRLLITFTNQDDQRNWRGMPFPSLTIFDGNGTITFGSETATGITRSKANDFTLFNAFKWVEKRHVFTLGTDVNYAVLDNRGGIPSYFGAYQFRSLNDFITGASPSRFFRTFYLKDEPANPVKFNTLRTSFFINDEIRPSSNLKLTAGIRLDGNSIPTRTNEDRFFNDTGITKISMYYDLEGTRSGEKIKTHWALSPRISAEYKLAHDVMVKGGAGIFLGHIVNNWPFNVFNSVTGTININPQQYNLRFLSDPYNQPTPESLNIDPANVRGNLNLISKRFKYPSVFRSSFIVEKRLKNSWTFSYESIVTKNIHEATFRNVNILHPLSTSGLPDSRNIYSFSSAPIKIPLRSNGINPYEGIFLLTNNPGKKGYSFSHSIIINKQSKNFSLNSSYTYGRSIVLAELTGPQTPIPSQWRNMETVNGRNFATLSISDNELKHRIAAWLSKKVNYVKSKASTTICLFYNGQSGSPYSYVYLNSMINDNGRQGENFDLIYIPTVNDLSVMSFTPITNNTGDVLYSPEQQKAFLNTFIEDDKYLRNHRGGFAERNGARLPFTHIIDLRLQQDFTVKLRKKYMGVTITYDVFNFTNMLNRNWGRTFFLLNDSYPLITFTGYASTSPVPIQQYQFRPFNGKPYLVQTSTLPGNSARWISQLGMKINLN
ncbi:MAG: TonB-dependent receptor [Flavisolibacter sp.]|nr:TonB-dependent receptor [Flavisolibacter sp.]